METASNYEFSVNKENCTVKVTREFKALLSEVWAAWTNQNILDQWWAPKPWKSRTRSMVFSEGGIRHYAMVGPGGEEHWSFAKFKSITPESGFTFHDGFCNKELNINNELPQSDWQVEFTDQNSSTVVTITIKHKNLSDLERILEMGFKEGFTMALENLDEVLSK